MHSPRNCCRVCGTEPHWWCLQTTSHCLIRCWPRSMSPYGVTWPQWFSIIWCVVTFIVCIETRVKTASQTISKQFSGQQLWFLEQKESIIISLKSWLKFRHYSLGYKWYNDNPLPGNIYLFIFETSSTVFVRLSKLEIVDQWSTRIPPPHRRE